jgi:hypothetical protein
MEAVKAENEALRQRVRALERALQARRRDSSNSDVTRPDLTHHVGRDRGSTGPHTSPIMSNASVATGGVAAWAASGSGVGGVAPPRERSESQSTTASSRRGIPAEDEVRLGESAGSVGIGRSS